MAKFISFDGVDKNGIRAEVTVQTGTGVISEIVGRGKPKDDGSYRNVEVVFDPDNPLLKRKVYGLLDTTATEIWSVVQKAHKEQSTVSYRIESQRRSGVDRATPIGDLNATEQVRRILASVDGVFSHEAKTNPVEDPSNENPSALTQMPPSPVASAGAAVPSSGLDVEGSVAALGAAIAYALPTPVIAATAASALTAGASVEVVQQALRSHPIVHDTTALFTTDGTVNYSSAAIEVACDAEQFALDHLIRLYTPARSTTPISVTDEVVAQAAALAIELLTLTDGVLSAVTGEPSPARQTRAFQRAFSIVCDAVDHRHPAPLGGTDNDKDAWRANVTEEATDRMRALADIAQNSLPHTSTPAPAAAEQTAASAANNSTPAQETAVHTGSEGITKPDTALVDRVKKLCADAGVTGEPRKISDWLERELGARMVSEIDAGALARFCDKYEAAGPDVVAADVLYPQETLV